MRRVSNVGDKPQGQSFKEQNSNEQYYNIKISKDWKHSSKERVKNNSWDLFKISSIRKVLC